MQAAKKSVSDSEPGGRIKRNGAVEDAAFVWDTGNIAAKLAAVMHCPITFRNVLRCMVNFLYLGLTQITLRVMLRQAR